MRKRPIKISLRLNEQEHEHLKQQAILSGFPMEVFLRALISGMNLRSRPLAEYAEIRRQLAGIGNNINQIAHVVNTRGFATKEDIAAVTTAQRVIWQIAQPPFSRLRARFLLYRSIPASGTQASKYCLWIQRFMV